MHSYSQSSKQSLKIPTPHSPLSTPHSPLSTPHFPLPRLWLVLHDW
ncbi:hypothetical protein [Tolypothrix sp. VBCCA 56010]